MLTKFMKLKMKYMKTILKNLKKNLNQRSRPSQKVNKKGRHHDASQMKQIKKRVQKSPLLNLLRLSWIKPNPKKRKLMLAKKTNQ